MQASRVGLLMLGNQKGLGECMSRCLPQLLKPLNLRSEPMLLDRDFGIEAVNCYRLPRFRGYPHSESKFSIRILA